MYQTVTLTDGTHFRFHCNDRAGLRVSFDQTNRETGWGLIPYPPTGYAGSQAQWIADYSCPPGGCRTIMHPADLQP